MLLTNNKKKLFDEAYSNYIKINSILENIYTNRISNPFQEQISLVDLTCSLDLYLQGTLLKIGVSDNQLAAEEIEFIMSLPDNLEHIYSQTRGYRRFLRNITVETFNSDSSNFFDFEKIPNFFLFVQQENKNDCQKIIDLLVNIFNDFIAIDDTILPCENKVAINFIKQLKDTIYQSENKNSLINPQENNLSIASEQDELENAIQELEQMIGLEEVKKEVLTSINMIKINKLRKEKGLPELQTSNHMVFTGSPGTGKTTVARILAKIYKALGIVSKGQLIETDRSGMVAGYVGQTALKTTQVIKQAVGGVLFIDEAYSLASEDSSNDYGKEAIDTLVKGMEDNRNNLVVIVAGYTEEMKKFISINPGLRSRFNKYITFSNYTTDELMQIFKRQCNNAKFIIAPKALEKARIYFMDKENNNYFGNARGVRNYFDCIVRNQATRILSLNNASETEFTTIEEQDLDNIEIE